MEIDLRELLKEETRKAIEEPCNRYIIEKQILNDKKQMGDEIKNVQALINAFNIYKYFIDNVYESFIAHLIKNNHRALCYEAVLKESDFYDIFNIKIHSRGQDYDKDNKVHIYYDSANRIVFEFSSFKYDNKETLEYLKEILIQFLRRNNLSVIDKFRDYDFSTYSTYTHSTFEEVVKSYYNEKYYVLPLMEEEIKQLILSYGEGNLDDCKNHVKTKVK